ncbi:MAG: CsbD family protein [Chlamydiales bacterium]
MDQNEFQAKWNELKGQIKQKWGKLTDNDLSQITGNKDKLISALQERYGYMKDQAVKQVNSWLDSLTTKLKK